MNNRETIYIEQPGCIRICALLSSSMSSLMLLVYLATAWRTGEFVVWVFPYLISVLVLSVGLGQMRKWAWWGAVVVQAQMLLAALLSLMGSIFAGEWFGVVLSLLVGMLHGMLLFWLIDNRILFDARSAVLAFFGPHLSVTVWEREDAGLGALAVAFVIAVIYIPVGAIFVVGVLMPWVESMVAQL